MRLLRVGVVAAGILVGAGAIGPPPASATSLPSIISSDMTLTASGSPYTGGYVTIDSGVTVTVEPDATVQTSGLTVNGTLDVNATASQPAVFTSQSDSGVGQWDGITLNSSSSDLSQSEVRYAAIGIQAANGTSPIISNVYSHDNQWAAILLGNGDATVTDNTIEHSPGIAAAGGNPEIANNSVSHCDGGGGIGQSLSSGSGEVRIHDNTVDGCGSSSWAAIEVNAANNESSSLTGVTLADNTVTDSTGRAISYDANAADDVIPPDIDENDISGGVQDGIWVAGRLETSTTWEDQGFPIVLRASNYNRLLVASGATLTPPAPGLVLKAVESTNNLAGTIQGSLVADGTAVDPITVTSIRDDSVGGDTNGDGSATEPAAGDWYGIVVEGDALLDNVRAQYGGTNGPNCNWCWGGGPMFSFWSGPSTVTNSTFEDTEIIALEFLGGDPTISANTLSRAGGISYTGDGSPEISANTVSDCGASSGIAHTVPYNQGGEINIHDNTIDNCGSQSNAALQVRADNYATGISVTGVSLADNVVTDGGGRAIEYLTSDADDTIPPDIDENTLSGNASNAIWMSGIVAESTTWEDRGYPIVTQAGSYYGDFTVASGATLTVGPGLVLKPVQDNGHTKILVEGELIADGTASEPITFTSIKDDSVGGDTNADGNATSPAPGDYIGIALYGGRGTFNYVHARYGGGDGPCGQCGGGGPMLAIADQSGDPTTVRNSRFSDIEQTAISVGGDPAAGSEPQITRNTFTRLLGLAIDKGGSQVLFAPHNIFDCISGPSPRGCGAAVGALVNALPWDSFTDLVGKCPAKQRKRDCPAAGDPVSLVTGAFTYEHTDLSLSNQGDSPLEFTRSYDSGNRADAGLGPGWSNSSIMLASELESGDVVIYNFDGRQDYYRKVAGDYIAPAGGHDVLTKAGGQFTLASQDRIVYDFDGTGRITLITDDHGLETDYDYDANGRLDSITDPAGQSLSFSYDASNHITAVSDSAGREVSFTYSNAGDLATVTDALGGVTEYGYDGQRRLTSITDPRDVTFLTNSYDGQGRVVEQENGEADVWTLDYSQGETSVTEPEGGTTTYEFNSDYQVTSMTDQLDRTTSYSYDTSGNLASVTEPGGAVTSYNYDARGNLLSAIDPEGGERTYTYDGSNRVQSMTDERGKTWDYTWDPSNDLTEIEDPASKATTIDYNAAGQPTEITDANGNPTTLAYDARGNLTSVEDALANATSYGYDAYNQLTSKTRPGVAAETYDRNELGDLLSVTTPEGNETSFDYDENGGLIGVTDPGLNQWQIERDAMERPTAFVDPLLNRTEIGYDGNSNPVSLTDRRSETTTYTYDLASQLTEVDAPDTGAWQFGYDGRGNRDEVIDPRQNVTTYAYDLADRLVAVSEPLQTSTSYGYDAAGNLTSIVDPRANETTFAYDDLGRLSEIDQPLLKTTTFDYDAAGNLTERATAEDTLALSYDDDDRLTAISDGTTMLRSYGYDDANRLTEATDVQSKTLEFGYDDDNNLVSVDDDRGQTVSRGFDSRGNLTSQTDGRGTVAYVYDELNRMTELTDPQSDTLSFSYDDEGNLTESTLPNGVVTTNTYDGAERMLSTSSEDSVNAVLQSFDYTYDAAGNRTSQTDRNSDETTYDYDGLNRLTQFDPPSAPVVGYGYDDAGNRTEAGSTTYSYNALNQLTSDSTGSSYDYDGAGRLVEASDGGSSTTSYSWDALDQLLEVDDGSGSVSYSYDALGRRSERSDSSGTETAHYGDLTDVAVTDTDSTNVLRTFVRGPIGLAERSDGSSVAFPLANAHGDVTTMTDNAGALDSRQAWDPWGQQLAGPALEMGWLGAYERRFDPSAGIVQMGVRTYGPGMGRFLSEDPVLGHLEIPVSLNRYPYAFNDPMNMYDLSGRDACTAVGQVPVIGGGLNLSCETLEEGANVAWDGTAGPRDAIAGGAEWGFDRYQDASEAICDVLPEGSMTCLDPLDPTGGMQDFIQYLPRAGGNCVKAGGGAAGYVWASGGTVVFRGLGAVGTLGAGLGGCAVGGLLGGLGVEIQLPRR